MKKKVFPILMCGALLASSVPAQAAWTTTNPAGSAGTGAPIVQSQGYSSYFTDIGGHWAQRFIEQWAANGVFGGMGNGTFSPNTSLTRAQYASVLMQLFDLQMVTEDDYSDYRVPSDVASSHWGRKAIAACLDNGIMNLRNGSFAPDQPITREEVFFSLGKAAKLDQLNVTGSSALNRFTDGASVSAPAREVIGKMVSLGMLAGRGNNRLEPYSTITRAEVSTILSKAVTYESGKNIKNQTYQNAVIFDADKGGDLTLTKVKVNGNLFIKGANIDTVELDDVDVTGTIYIYADSVDGISLTDVTDTDFVIVSPDVAFTDCEDSDGNTFTFVNANTVVFEGEAEEITIKGEFLDSLEVNGKDGDGIEVLNVEGSDASEYDLKLSGVIDEANVDGDVNLTGYARVKTLTLDDGNYESTMAADKVKVLSGKLKVNGNTYSKGTYQRHEITGAVAPDVDNTNDSGISSSHIYTLNSNTVPAFYYDKHEDIDYIKVDGDTLSSSEYDVNTRQHYFEIDRDYLNDLSVGKYTVKVYYEEGGNDSFTLTVKKYDDNFETDYTFVKGSGDAMRAFVGNSSYKAYSVTIDGYSLGANDYTHSNGYLTIRAERMANLSVGVHTVRCYFTNGAETTIVVKVVDNSQVNLVTPRTVHHVKGSVYSTVHTYNSSYYPAYVTIDGSVLSSGNYQLNVGTRTLQLNSGYVNTLTAGKHLMRVYFTDGKYDDVSVIVSDEAQITSYIFDKTPASTYYRNVNVSGISSYPTMIVVDNKVMPQAYYGYNSATQEAVLYKEYFANLNTGEHTVVISYGNTSRTVKVVVQQSTDKATFVFDKNTAAANYRDLVLTGNISSSNLAVYVNNRQLNPSEYTYASGSVTIRKEVFSAMADGTYYIGVTSAAGNASATVTVIDTKL